MDEREFQRGVIEAQKDISAGAPRLFCQTRGAWGEKYTELMRDRFGVEVVHVSDMTWESKQSYEQGYNKTIESHVDEVFGSGTFDAAWAEIQEFRLEYHRRWLASQDGSGTPSNGLPANE
jgi:hypothetical protein